MKVYFIRHGESESNKSNTHGTSTTSLSKLGIKQAKTVADRLSDVDPDIIVSSKYVRAMQTATIIGKVLAKKIVYTPLLNEWRVPSDLHGIDWRTEKNAEVWRKINKSANDPKWHYSDEENAFEVITRAEKAIRYLSSRKENKVVVVAHAGIIKTILHLAIFGNVDFAKLHQINALFKSDNTGITELEIEKGKVTRIVTFNDHAHLQ